MLQARRMDHGRGWLARPLPTPPGVTPVQFNLLTFRHTLADLGRCPFCMFDSKLPPRKRMHQFLDRTNWRDHVRNHFRQLGTSTASVLFSYTRTSRSRVSTNGVPYFSTRFATCGFICRTSTASPESRTTQ